MAMEFSREDWRQYRWAYHRLVEKVDAQIGRVLKALADEGLADNTVIIFTSDHGDGYGAHRWRQKSALYDESCRVPFIISVPGGPRWNETDNRLISVGIDMMGTVSDLVGTEMPEGPYYGISAMPFVMSRAGKARSHPCVVTEAEVRDSPGGDYEGRAVGSSQFKYHVWNKGERREQLFDMIRDPGETTNLAGRTFQSTRQFDVSGMLGDPRGKHLDERDNHRDKSIMAYPAGRTDSPYGKLLTISRTRIEPGSTVLLFIPLARAAVSPGSSSAWCKNSHHRTGFWRVVFCEPVPLPDPRQRGCA